MKLCINKTRYIPVLRKTNTLTYNNKVCQSPVTHTNSCKDLGVLTDSELQFHNPADYIFSQYTKHWVLSALKPLHFLAMTAYVCFILP